MKTLFLATLLGFALAAVPASAATLTVEVDGVRSAGGRLHVSVQTREQFMRAEGVAGGVVETPRAGTHRFTYEVPEGQYAVSVWHDDNGNGAFDSDDRHLPLDGWAMVNGDRIRAEPTFDEVKTVVGAGPATVRLSMIYGR